MAGAAILHCWLLRPGLAGQGERGRGPCVRHPCGMVQSGAGEMLTLMLCRGGASGGFPSPVSEVPWVKVRAWALAVRRLLRNGEAGPR